MREILFRGKRVDTGDWIFGQYINLHNTTYCTRPNPKEEEENEIHQIVFEEMTDWCLPNRHLRADVDVDTVSQFSGFIDKNGKRIFEGDIVQYNDDDFGDSWDCQSVVKFGEYKQDGSSGEYRARVVCGWFVDVDNFTCPSWAENQPELFPEYHEQRGLTEVWKKCKVIGNLWDNPEFVKEGEK